METGTIVSKAHGGGTTNQPHDVTGQQVTYCQHGPGIYGVIIGDIGDITPTGSARSLFCATLLKPSETANSTVSFFTTAIGTRPAS